MGNFITKYTYLLSPLCIAPLPPREGVLRIDPPLEGCPEMSPPREGALNDLLPRLDGVIVLPVDGAVLRESLKMTLLLLGTPVEINSLERVTPIPA